MGAYQDDVLEVTCCENKSGRVNERDDGRTIFLSSSTPPFLHSIFIT
jgi:hypothetical protein